MQVLRFVDGGQLLKLIGGVEMGLRRKPSSQPAERLGSVVEAVDGRREVGGRMWTCSGYFLYERERLVANSRDEVVESLAAGSTRTVSKEGETTKVVMSHRVS